MLLYGLVMALLGFVVGLSIDNSATGDAVPAPSTDSSPAVGVSAPESSVGESGAGEDGDSDKDKPVPLADLMLDTGPANLPQALLAGQFVDSAMAESLMEQLQDNGFEARIVETIDDNHETWFMVVLDTFDEQAQLQFARYQLQRQMDIKAQVIRPPPKAD